MNKTAHFFNFKLIFYVLFLAIILNSCGTTNLASKQLLISPGDSKNDVVKVLGNPSDRQFQGTMEAWQYCSTGFNIDKYTIIWMNSGIVTGLNTYSMSCGTGPCTQCFRPVRWEDAPDAIIEHRVR